MPLLTNSRPAFLTTNPEALQREIVRLTSNVENTRARIAKIDTLKPAELGTLLGADSAWGKLVALLRDVNAKDAELATSGLAADHPQRKALNDQREAAQRGFEAERKSIRLDFVRDLATEETMLKSVKNRLAEAPKITLEDKQAMREYMDAKNKYIQARKVMETMLVTYAAEQMEASLQPVSSPETRVRR